MKKEISDAKIVIATHYYVYSASQALRDYLLKMKCGALFYISHPLCVKGDVNSDRSFAQLSVKGKNCKRFDTGRRSYNLIVSSIFESFLSLYWILKSKGNFDLFIGVDNLNAIIGLLLKKISKVKKVVYYTIDYFPDRFENKYLNQFYHFIDKLCVKYADETWNVSSMMVSAREKYNGMDRRIFNRQYEVPIGVWFDNSKQLKFQKVDKKKLVFVGHLLSYMGVDLVIKALPEISKKIKGIRLEIVGGGEDEKRLKSLVKKLGLEDNVKFYGWIKDRNKLERIIADGAIGMATFNTKILDDKVKNADPGKIKDYMLMGMPVIVTGAVSTAGKIQKARAGLIVDYDSKELAKAVLKLLKNARVLREYRENAVRYVKMYDYPDIFYPALNRVLRRSCDY